MVVAAISTPIGTGAISIVRMTGDGCIDIAARLFVGIDNKSVKRFRPRTLYLGHFVSDDIKEICMCVVFPAPKSYTGEDMVEFQVHGGIAVTDAVLKGCLDAGASLASNGDFARRAFLNGKISLASAEGTLELINSTALASANAAYSLVSERFSKTVKGWATKIVDEIAAVEVALDYPEEDTEEQTLDRLRHTLEPIADNIYNLLSTRPTAMRVTDGINVALIGMPNVGKSSLLNALLGVDRAIVSDIAGTTRDSITERVDYHGMTFNFIDTAGIRNITTDAIEKLGIARTKNIINMADIVLVIVDDLSLMLDFKICELVSLKKKIIVLNKVDAHPFISVFDPVIQHDISVSAMYGYNINKLMQMIYDMVIDQNVINGSLMLTNQRHYACMSEAYQALKSALDNPDLNTVVLELRQTAECLGKISGENVTEEVINRIFERFCLGK